MSITLSQSYSAIGPGLTSSFLAIGGAAPYSYTVLPNGAGGTIDPVTGVYTAPAVASSSPNGAYDVVSAADSLGASGSSRILVGLPLMLFCDIIQKGLGLADGRIYLWDQKIFEPKDYDLFVAVSVPMCKPFGNSRESGVDAFGAFTQVQSVNMYAHVDVDILSRGPAARDRKEEVILALNSNYAEQQKEANSFGFGILSTAFVNLSQIDAAAIPYRYKISVGMQYFVRSQSPVSYFDSFSIPSILVDN